MASIIGSLSKQIASKLFTFNTIVSAKQIHTSAALCDPKHFLTYNKKVYPPQEPDETPRPAVSIGTVIFALIRNIHGLQASFPQFLLHLVCVPSN